jgi:hypothetical protein
MLDLEKKLQYAIVNGQPKTNKPWKNIWIAVEGIYSMDASICPLPELVDLKKKYGAYLYIDEAHSIGVAGATGRGVVEHFGLNPSDVDLLMGTLSKAFSACGGYIGGAKKIIDYLRINSYSKCYAPNIAPPLAGHIIAALDSYMNDEAVGVKKVQQLASNANYFRSQLKKRGFIVHGDDNVPVFPIMTFAPTKAYMLAKLCKDQGVGAIPILFPAVPYYEDRVRFCVSASHTKSMMDDALEIIDKAGSAVNCKFAASAECHSTLPKASAFNLPFWYGQCKRKIAESYKEYLLLTGTNQGGWIEHYERPYAHVPAFVVLTFILSISCASFWIMQTAIYYASSSQFLPTSLVIGLFAAYFYLLRSRNSRWKKWVDKVDLIDNHNKSLTSKWTPEPITQNMVANNAALKPPIISGKVNTYIYIYNVAIK